MSGESDGAGVMKTCWPLFMQIRFIPAGNCSQKEPMTPFSHNDYIFWQKMFGSIKAKILAVEGFVRIMGFFFLIGTIDCLAKMLLNL